MAKLINLPEPQVGLIDFQYYALRVLLQLYVYACMGVCMYKHVCMVYVCITCI